MLPWWGWLLLWLLIGSGTVGVLWRSLRRLWHQFAALLAAVEEATGSSLGEGKLPLTK